MLVDLALELLVALGARRTVQLDGDPHVGEALTDSTVAEPGTSALATLNETAALAGSAGTGIVAFVPGVVTSDVDSAREKVVRQMAFYEQVPSYQRIIGLEGATRAAELAVIGDEETVAAQVKRYFDAGATEVVFTTTDLAGDADQLRTRKVLVAREHHRVR